MSYVVNCFCEAKTSLEPDPRKYYKIDLEL